MSRQLSIDQHARLRVAIGQDIDAATRPEIDDDLINVDPFNGEPPSRRSDKELARTLAILDSLEEVRGNA